jgi:hypothetical protein
VTSDPTSDLAMTSYEYHSATPTILMPCRDKRGLDIVRNPEMSGSTFPVPGITSARGFSSKRIFPYDHTVSRLVLRDAPGIQATSLTPSYLPLVTVQGKTED